jgi:hypothetical protein
MNLSKFKLFFENQFFGIRYTHKNGEGLMNRDSFDLDKLNDDEYFEVEDGFLKLRQPHQSIHSLPVIFVFTPEGEKKHKNLIRLLKKASKYGTKRIKLPLTDYEIVWNSNDGQLGLIPKQKT